MIERAVHAEMVTRATSFDGLARNTDETIRPEIELIAKVAATFSGMIEIWSTPQIKQSKYSSIPAEPIIAIKPHIRRPGLLQAEVPR